MPKPGINLKMGLPMFFAAFVIGALALYGGAQLVKDDSASAEGGIEANAGGTPGGPVNVTVVAQNLLFKTRNIAATTGASVTVNLDNQDSGVLHDIAFFTNKSATTKIAGAAIDPFAGPATKSVTFTAPATPGSYFFRCNVHPDSMTGALSVK